MKPEELFEFYLPCKNRDRVRAFRGTDRRSVLSRYGYRCAICCRHEKELPTGLDIHHIRPWSTGGRTIISNGLPLCRYTCHGLADLGAWSPEYLSQLTRYPHQLRRDLSPNHVNPLDIYDLIFTADTSKKKDRIYWRKRVIHLMNQWTHISENHHILGRERLAKLSAKLLWSISQVITTHVPADQNTVWWRRWFFPVSRVIGITFAERARKLIEHSSYEPSAAMSIGITYTISVHYRSLRFHDRALYQYVKHAQALLDEDNASVAVPDPAERAYYLTGYSVDLATKGRVTARDAIERALNCDRNSGEPHAVADTLMRVSEVENRLGNPRACLGRFEECTIDGRSWDLVINDIPIVKAIAHKICAQAYWNLQSRDSAEYHLSKALELATEHRLEDQRTKILRLNSEFMDGKRLSQHIS